MKPIKSDWTDVVLVCRKCAKKLKGGFGPKGKTPLVEALREEIGAREKSRPMKKPRRKGAHVTVFEVPCLDVCPKGMAIVVPGGDPGRWRLVKPGADLSDLLDDIAPR